MNVLRFLPLSYISWCVGVLANLPLPQPLARWSISIFAWAYGIDVTAATRPLEAFCCIGEFFTRDLPPQARPQGTGLVSPVDGTLRAYHELAPGLSIPQVKGKEYTLSQLLGGDPFTARLERGAMWNMYLSPSDVHHIFSPVHGRIVRTVHIPGKLWPVNDWALGSVDRLFAVNERVVTFIETECGLVAVVMIGACNVGRIILRYTALETNTRPWARRGVRAINHTDSEVRSGDKLGTFMMGSSVILIAESYRRAPNSPAAPCCMRYGESL